MTKIKSIFAFFLGAIFLMLAERPAHSSEFDMLAAQVHNVNRFTPQPPKLEYSVWRTGPLEIAKIFGRSGGCRTADMDFIQDTNSAAIRAGLDPKVVAATIVTESDCDPLSISNRGAVGAMQIRVSVWKDTYDFEEVNLLNRRDNLKVGTEILAQLIQQYGTAEGIRRYQGTGQNCSSCDDRYTEKILNLAGRK